MIDFHANMIAYWATIIGIPSVFGVPGIESDCFLTTGEQVRALPWGKVNFDSLDSQK